MESAKIAWSEPRVVVLAAARASAGKLYGPVEGTAYSPSGPPSLPV